VRRYEYHRPTSLDEALALASAQPDARFVAGGTDVLVQIRRNRDAVPPALISLRSVEELTRIEDGGRLRIGAATPLTDVVAHPRVVERYPALAEAIRSLGSRQVRNVATVGGNLCNASPCASTAPPLLVHEATLELHDAAGTREMPIGELFRGPGETDLRPGELLVAIVLDPPSPGTRATFLGKGRVHVDLDVASVAALVERDGGRCTKARVAAGAVAPTPLRLLEVERLLEGSTLDDDVVARAAEKASAAIAPICDVRASDWYRRQLTGVLLKRALARIAPAMEVAR